MTSADAPLSHTPSIPPSLPFHLERTVMIRAPRETVFRYFTDSARWAAWWGAGSSIDPRPGGPMVIRYPNGTEARGEVLEVAPPERIAFTYGYASGDPIAAGSSRVTIQLIEEGAGTRVRLTHALADAAVRDEHVQGWRCQLSLFSNVVSDEINAGAADRIDAWFAAWNEVDDAARGRAFGTIACTALSFHDRHSAIDGVGELSAQVGAYHRFMPGIRVMRRGDMRHCQGVALAEWAGVTEAGEERMSGTNVFVLDGAGRIEAVTGLWAAPSSAAR
jgi:uncharacterized protein YndB with AHSA1/START domain